MIIAVDFDGTVVTHEFPAVGRDVPLAVETLKELDSHGHRLILWTMRSGEYLDAAVEWYKEREIPLWGINANAEQCEWTESPKCYAQLYIDDAAFGCPLITPDNDIERPFVNWEAVRERFGLEIEK